MAKKKKGAAKRKDARGYGQQQPATATQPSPPKVSAGRLPPPKQQQGPKKSPIAVTAPPAKNKVVQVSTKTHEGLLELLLQLTEQEEERDGSQQQRLNPHVSARIIPATIASEPRILTSKVTKVVEQLEHLKFTMKQIEQVATALGYAFTTLETSLDWLCFHLPSSELPSLFAEQQVRDNQQQQQQNHDPLTVLKFTSTSETSPPAHSTSAAREKDDAAFPATIVSDQEESEKLKQKQKEHDDEAKARKAWLLSQYEYEDSENDEDEVRVEQAVMAQSSGASPSRISRASEESPPIHTPREQSKEGTKPSPLSPQEIQLSELEEELKVARDELSNEANNYMRSKQETKQLATQVKKLQQQVSGLRKKVDKQRAKEQAQIENTAEEDAPPFGDNIFGNSAADDEDERYGADLFSSFGGTSEQETAESISEVTDSGVTTSDQNQPIVDYSVPNGWTGTTPQKTLNEYYQHKKRKTVAKPRYFKLPGNRGNKKDCGYRLVIFTEKGEKVEFSQDKGNHVRFLGDVQEYLATQALYALEPSQPLYRRFPPVFRDLWLSWLNAVQQEAIQQKEDDAAARVEKIERILSLVNESSTSASVPDQSLKDLPTAAKQDVRSSMPVAENWDDIDAGTGELPDSWEDYGDDNAAVDAKSSVEKVAQNSPINPSRPAVSSKGARLRDEFVQRQSTQAYQKMFQIRSALPMYTFRDKLLSTIRENPVTILCAETGAGK